MAYPWPGNVRELANVMERVALLADAEQVSPAVLDLSRGSTRRAASAELDAGVDEQLATLERSQIEKALHAAGWNISRAAAHLGLPRNTLRYRMERHGLSDGTAGVKRRRRPEAAWPRPPGAASPSRDRAEAAPEVRWQRTRVTLLAAHVADSDAIVADHERRCALEQVAARASDFGGRVIQLGASDVVVAFGLEPAEDAPRHAAHAALAILHGARAERLLTAQPAQLGIVLHAEELLVGRLGDRVEIDADALGAAEHVLATLRASAAGEPLLVSAETKALLERRFLLEPVTAADDSGVVAWRVTGLLDITRRTTPFVARAREVELLEDLFTQAQEGRGQAVLLVGDPGIGKSRLLQELRLRTSDRAGWLEGHAVSFGRSLPFHPLIDLLKRACSVEDGDSEQVIGDKIEQTAAPFGPALRAAIPFLRSMLSIDPGDPTVTTMDPKLRRAGMFDAVRQLLLASAGVDRASSCSRTCTGWTRLPRSSSPGWPRASCRAGSSCA